MNDISYLAGLPPKDVDLWKAQADFNSDSVLVVVDRANVTPAPTSAAWSYDIPFRLVGENTGLTLPYTGNVGASVTDTSSAGTASIDDSTPAVVMGRGKITISGNAASWLNTETATATITYTNLRGGTDTDTFVVTFTS